jgi:hypothetical protein
MAIIVATLLLFLAGPFVLWPLIRTPEEAEIDGSSGGAARRPPRQAGS